MENQFNVGVGLRPQHYSYLREHGPKSAKWFEVITENFLYTEGNPLKILEDFRERSPLSFHGVSLNLGSWEELDQGYLKQVKELYKRFDPFLVSDHLCWTGSAKNSLHNLLPLPYTEETLNHLVSRIQYYQDYIGREIAIENLSAYVTSNEQDYSEWNFLAELAKRAGCKILLDINNIYVNSVNFKFDPKEYLDAIPTRFVSEIHLAGHTDMGDYLFDTHSAPVCDEVWELFKYKWTEDTNIPTLIEWDEDIPTYPELEKEVDKAIQIGRNINEKS